MIEVPFVFLLIAAMIFVVLIVVIFAITLRPMRMPDIEPSPPVEYKVTTTTIKTKGDNQ